MFKLMLFLHLLGATVWTGGHLVLSLTVLPRALRWSDPDIVRGFEDGFERIGIPALVIQVLTGLWLAYRLVPDVSSWFSFESGVRNLVALKLVLLLLTVVLALHARFRIIPSLSQRTLPILAWHVAAVTIVSVLFVFVGVSFRTGGLL